MLGGGITLQGVLYDAQNPEYLYDKSCFMKVVRTRVPEHEYVLLAKCAARTEKTLQQALRDAIRKMVLKDEVDPQDPVFALPPGGKPNARKRRISERQDELLYGSRASR